MTVAIVVVSMMMTMGVLARMFMSMRVVSMIMMLLLSLL